MNRFRIVVLIGLSVFLLSGCFRAGLFFWSPDGSKAILNSDENWYVIAEPDFQPVSLARNAASQWCPIANARSCWSRRIPGLASMNRS
jgi:hypothetical protein